MKLKRGIARYGLSIVMGLAVCALLVSLVGVSPATLFTALLGGSVDPTTNILNVIRWATPEILVGLSFAISAKAGLFNLGIDGQLYVGALAAALVGIYAPLPIVVAPVVALLVGTVAGAGWASISAWLLNRFGVTEVVSTLMLNYIAALFTSWLIKTYFLQNLGGASSYTIATPPVRPEATLPVISPASQANLGFLIAIVVAVALFFLVYRTRAGYELRALGSSAKFARYDGLSVPKVRFGALALSGAIAGLAGGLEVLGVQQNFVAGFSNNLGFDGIIVSIIGMHNPLGIIFSGAFFGALKNTGLTLALDGNVSSYVVTLLTAIFIFAFSIRIHLRRKKRVR